MSSRDSGIAVIVILLAGISGCSTGPDRARVLGEAYAGPISVQLRSDLAPGTKVVATVQHGDRLAIIQTRRRFVKVRTAGGVEGWTDTRQLLTAEQIAELKGLAASSARLPSQGAATVYDTLNMHTQPFRQAPSFYQVKEGMKLDVLDHQLMARKASPPPGPPLIKPPPPPQPKEKKHKAESKVPPPPRPEAAHPPSGWVEMSRNPLPPHPPEEKKPAEKVAMDDWTLVRAKDGPSGWVLTRNLIMAIPDEVAQYAEGHRISSYFQMRDIHDDEQGLKHDWLWTTVRGAGEEYQFDGLRYFIWNKRKHRYETNYIERNLEGYYPVLVQPGPEPKFSVVVREADGKLYRRHYAWDVYRIRLMSSEPYTKPAEPELAPEFPAELTAQGEGAARSRSLRERLATWTRNLISR